jgi:hypothetical protein
MHGAEMVIKGRHEKAALPSLLNKSAAKVKPFVFVCQQKIREAGSRNKIHRNIAAQGAFSATSLSSWLRLQTARQCWLSFAVVIRIPCRAYRRIKLFRNRFELVTLQGTERITFAWSNISVATKYSILSAVLFPKDTAMCHSSAILTSSGTVLPFSN